MPTSCQHALCRNTKGRTDNTSISYHSFPPAADQIRRQQWIQFCRREDVKNPRPRALLCSEHFVDDCWISRSVPVCAGRRNVLKSNAVPTIHPDFRTEDAGHSERKRKAPTDRIVLPKKPKTLPIDSCHFLYSVEDLLNCTSVIPWGWGVTSYRGNSSLRAVFGESFPRGEIMAHWYRKAVVFENSLVPVYEVFGINYTGDVLSSAPVKTDADLRLLLGHFQQARFCSGISAARYEGYPIHQGIMCPFSDLPGETLRSPKCELVLDITRKQTVCGQCRILRDKICRSGRM